MNQPQKFRANVYVDGFNLYYGCLRKTKYKWLNLELLAIQLLNPESYEINKIYYCTADVIDYQNDGITTRQGFYLNALRTLPKIEIIKGKFKAHEKSVRVDPPLKVILDSGFGPSRPVDKSIFKGLAYEEKGTDVNLATQLLIDLYGEKFDTALVISNDTDYKMAINQVRIKKKKIVMVNTRLNCEPDIELRKVSSKSSRKTTQDILAAAQFPEVVTDKIRKPKTWE